MAKDFNSIKSDMTEEALKDMIDSVKANSTSGTISSVESCHFLKRLKKMSDIKDSEIIDRFLPLLGYSKSLKNLNMILGLDSLNSFFKQYVIERKMPLKHAYRITKMGKKVQARLETYAKTPGVSLSKVLKEIDLSHIISVKNNGTKKNNPKVKTTYEFDRIFIDRLSKDDEITQKIIKRLNIPHKEASAREVKDYVHKNYEDPIAGGKRILFLTRNKGKKLKKCPGTKNKICCGYYVINLYTNCPIDCSYCILQKYLNNPYIAVYTNFQDYLEDIDRVLSSVGSFLRIGTGELTDSLALDYLTDYSSKLIDFFSNIPNASLELKTKSVCIENILKKDPPGNVIISWSLNPQSLVKTDEIFAASLDERLKAARKCQDRGYHISFHFDPIILHEGSSEKYADVVDQMRRALDKDKVSFISMGALRFDPSLKPLMLERFPGSEMFSQEFTVGSDNKLRYIKSKRVEAFENLSSLLKKHFPKTHIYLCMEDETVWKRLGL